MNDDALYGQLVERKNTLCEQVENMVIENRETLEKAADLTKWIKVLVSKIEDERKEMTNGLRESLALINARYKELSEPLKLAESIAQGKITGYMNQANLPQAARGEFGSVATLRDHWTWEVTDITELAAARPDLVSPNSKALNEAVRKRGSRELPGVNIFNDRRSVIR